jgi:hypothetical protein
MSILKKIFNEIRIVGRTAAYFFIVFMGMMVMKKLTLKDYDIEFSGISQALVGALILSKVVLLMDLINLGHWVQTKPPIVDVLIRTLMYTTGVLVVVLLEKVFERRHESDGFINDLSYLINHRDIYRVWATTIGTGASILAYNAFDIVRRMLGKGGLSRLFFSTPLSQVEQLRMAQKITEA